MMEVPSASGSKHMSAEQRKLLITAVKSDSNLISGRFGPIFTKKDSIGRWQLIADNLNAVPGGVHKSSASWKKSWQDIRSRTKTKLAVIKGHSNATGGGKAHPEEMTQDEEDIFAVIKPVSFQGHQTVGQSVAEYEDGSLSENMYDEPETIIIMSESPQPPLAVPSPPLEPVMVETSTQETTKKRPRARTRAVEAVRSYEGSLKEKNKIKKDYYEQKLDIMWDQLTVMREVASYERRKAEALEKMAGISWENQE